MSIGYEKGDGRYLSDPEIISEEFVGFDFSGHNLEGRNFVKCFFKNCNFSRCQLSYAMFEECNISDCVMSGSRALNVIFDRCKIHNSDLAKMHMDCSVITATSIFKCDISDVDASSSIFTGSGFWDTRFYRSKLSFVETRDCELSYCGFVDANLDGMDVLDTGFMHCCFKGASMPGNDSVLMADIVPLSDDLVCKIMAYDSERCHPGSLLEWVAGSDTLPRPLMSIRRNMYAGRRSLWKPQTPAPDHKQLIQDIEQELSS